MTREYLEKSKKQGGFFRSLFNVILGLAILFGILALIVSVTSNTQNSSSRSRAPSYASWNGEGEMPRANIVVQTVQASGNSNGYIQSGDIQGFVYNRSGERISYISVEFGLYTEGGAKFASCYDSTNSLATAATWEFRANCFDWRSNTKYRLENVTYW